MNPSILINFGSVEGITQESNSLCTVSSVSERDMLGVPLSRRGTTLFDKEHEYISLENSGVRCGTGDSLVYAPDPWFMEEGVDMIDMELYAIVKSCHRFSVPWLSYKFVSDAADYKAHNDWQSRLISTFSVFELQLLRDSESILEFTRISKVERN